MTNIIHLFSRYPTTNNNLPITLLRYCIKTAQLAGYQNKITLSLLHKILESAPRSHSEYIDDNWAENSFCWRLINEAGDRVDAGKITEDSVWEIFNFWVKGFAVKNTNLRNTLLAQLKMLAEATEGHAGSFEGAL